MVIFVVAALAGFLLFGWIKASPWVRSFFLNRWVQGVLGLLALGVVAFSVVVQIFQWPEYWVSLIVQRLTGTEATQFILGAVFGCILRYWGPHFWEMRLRSETRYNWVAISLVGLLLLAAVAPYIERQLGGMTALKTSVLEFQFAGKNRAVSPMKEQHEIYFLMLLPEVKNIITSITNDLNYLELFQKEAQRIDDPSDKEELLQKIGKRKKIYNNTKDFIKYFLFPLAQCAREAQKKSLATESIRVALRPVAQKLRLLIESVKSQHSSPAIDPLVKEIEKSLNLLKGALLPKGRKKWCTSDEQKIPSDLEFLSKAPHIYGVLANMDGFNDNMEVGISILKKASDQFGDDHNLSPGILFNLNHHLSYFLYYSGYDPESIFRYSDKALKIAQDTGSRIDKWEKCKIDSKQCKLPEVKERFKKTERWAKNFLAYFSADLGVRKFMALRYAKENYDDLDKLIGLMKTRIIDTYGYVKMAFAVREVPTNFDEIKQAKALFEEAQSYVPEQAHDAIEVKHYANKILRSHLEQANRLLASR